MGQGARANCILRWQFVVQDHVLPPLDILSFMEKNNISLSLKSDDGLNYNLMQFMCYFGVFEGVQRLYDSTASQSLLNDPTEGNDIALTMALLSPLTDDDCKVKIATLIYPSSNLSICNRSSQNPVQITLLMGKIDLLFRMLPLSINLHYDRYRNSILHLAIKAGLSTVARYILNCCHFGTLDQVDCAGDSVLTLAIKAGDEDLACAILTEGANAGILGVNWCMPHCERDLCIHQAIKRGMAKLANMLIEKGVYLLSRDSEGNLPIHLALMHHLDSCVELLLSREDVSSFINEMNEKDLDTPLHLALKLGYYAHSKALIEHGANVNSTNRYGLTPCHILVMVAKGDYQSTAKESMTPEQIQELMEMMLARHPDLEIVNELTSEGGHETCLHMAIRGGAATENLARMCLKYAPKLASSRDCNEATPLILAVENGNLELVKELCDTGCELNVMNADRDTPLHIAVKRGDVDIVGGVM